MKRILATLGIFAALAVSAMAAGDEMDLDGLCTADSHTAEGPIGSDLTKRQSRFYCDEAVVLVFDNENGPLLVEFQEKEARHGPVLGFYGKLAKNGKTMPVDRIFMGAPGEAKSLIMEGVHLLSGMGDCRQSPVSR